MKTTKNILTGILAIIGFVANINPVAAQSAASGRTELQRHNLSIPGREVVQVRVEINSGAGYPKHTHPGEEIIYILEGVLEYTVGDQPPVTLKPGNVLFIPAGTVHSVRNVGGTKGAELATYILEKAKQQVTLVK
ncbi:cupin domain-containing protein [Mucilaginibacter sp. BT774]|uniref:cupin domain-containing protein n=1 Tax=Mucilaginibacter sp. BT774 TaxID=3062276 RepID=UPI002675133A|nr:cupin domain-containing protein [Mucilaginibacter sp. BT774]MDO3627574.1 cupin domain-containing protein [Mucilaginibacter sp. BT774]